MQLVSDKALWQRPFTNKRYLHPPFSENMFTMWPEMRLICGDVIEKTAGYISAGLRVLVGEDMQAPDFTRVHYHTRADGAPVHALHHDFEGYAMHMESFCNTERVCTCFTRFTVTGTGEKKVHVHLALLPRTGREDHLVGTEVDGYAQYDSNVHNWGFIPSGWRMEQNLLTDGEYEILLQRTDVLNPIWQGDGKGLKWYQRHLLKMDFDLLPGERVQFELCFRHGKVRAFDYDAQREKALQFWQGELKRLKIHPGGEAYAQMVNNLVLQCLQMFAYPVGKDYVLPRQGGLQRVIWPNEGVEFLTALDRLGDFASYTRTAYDTYFFTLQCTQGFFP